MFGGNGPNGATQISKVVGCELQRVGDLDFSFSYGACANRADAEIFLCFSDISGEGKRCRSSIDPEAGYARVVDSNYDHMVTRIAASDCKTSFRNTLIDLLIAEILAVGGSRPLNKSAELYSFETNTWLPIEDYPFGRGSFKFKLAFKV